MAHDAQRNFCNTVKYMFPEYFNKTKVLDCGSLDINGNNRHLFYDSEYVGVDIVNGNNVNIVCKISKAYEDKIFKDNYFDVVISTEMLEHDKEYDKSLQVMQRLLKPKGLMILTCACVGRNEHGTINHSPQDSPLTHDYYKNLMPKDIIQALDMSQISNHDFIINTESCDLYFWGFKK